MKDSITGKGNTLRVGLLETWNATETPYPDHIGIHQLFEQQAEKTPTATALIDETQTLSYAELNARANLLACQLIEQGICPGDHVAILLERSIELVVAQLAILKAGAVYVPVDPNVPDERKNWLINDSAAKLLLTDMQTEIPAEWVIPRFRFTGETEPIRAEEHRNPDLLGASTGPAYIMYTSGSTGIPKGVIVPHRAVVRLVINNGYADIEPSDRIAFAANPAFDASTFEVWAPLLNGAALVVIDHTTLLTPQDFVRALQAHRITVLWMSVGLFNRLAEALSPVLPQLNMLLVGGDVLDPHIIAQVLRKNPPKKLLNAYGPSEGTTFTTTYHIHGLTSDTTSIPIGRPIANTRIYLLDTDGQPVPLGMTGEIYIGGDGVACGYLNRPELTAERFLTDPFSDKPNARMYRSGDLARYLPDGNLEFLGRNDQQVKIRGFRIEPEEIEARLVEYPAIREAVVLALGEGQDKQLVAYVLTQENDGLAARLREHLSERLPDYMVPVAFVRLDEFPLTPNGKLDRRALPAPREDAFARQVYEAPLGEKEIVLATLWRELLGIEQISRHDSFFALGGHSLLGVRMIERLHSLGLTLAARNLFQCPTLSELARTLEQHQAVVVPPNVITPATTVLTPAMLPLIDLTQYEIDHIVEQVPGGIANIQDIYALSPLQDGILFHHLLAKEGDPYLLAYPMIFADRALLDRYLAAVQQVVNRHDILRTAFIWQGLSAPAQVVCRQAPLSVTELTLDPADGPAGEQLAHRFDPRQYRFDLSQAPLLRFVVAQETVAQETVAQEAVAQETDGRWHVLQLQHHLIGDHTTMEVMHREVQACLAGQNDNLPVPMPFRNLVAQARLNVNQAEHTRFFTDMLADVDEPTLPFGLTEVHRDGSQVTQSHRMLSPELNNRLRQQAKRLGVSVATLCHLAWAQVLSRASGQNKVVFGTVLFGRMAAGEGVDSGMGLFINTLPLRLDIDDTPVHDSVRLAQSRLAGLLDYEHTSLAQAQRCSGVAGGTPLFSALLNYRHNEQPLIPHQVVPGIEFLGEQERTNYPLVLSVEDGGSTLGLTAQVVQPFEPDRVCGYMQQALTSLAEALEQAPETPVRDLNILPETERALLLETWNATETPYPEQLCIHQLFEQQVEKTPVATALIAGDQTLSYTELNIRANRLARQLIEQGVYPGEHVAILLERSIELVVAQLAILKAGAVYVPIDPGVPDERKNWLIKDCSAKLLLTDMWADIPADLLAIPLFRLSGEMSTIREEDCLNPDLPASSTGSAYIMYTSGSTGTPKGVVVPHRAVVRLVINNGYAETGQDDRIAFTANPAFDASTFEVWTPLLNGGALVVIDHATLLTPQAFVQALQVHRITVLWLTVGLFNRLAAELSPVLPQINILIVGGDVLNPHVIAQVLRNSPPQQLLNGYGPSEGTTFTTTYRITEMPVGTTKLPIGRPISNTRLYLLNAYGEPVPLGAIGEIYIGGDGVACGYLNRPELTAERFLLDPFSDQPDARMYRTGDLARYLPDGNLEFFGRNDQQVKIRGFRIEPGEIETRLKEYPAVRGAAVLVLGDGQDKRLVAYIVAQADDGLINNLRAHLSAILPDYMVPAAFVRLDEFPLTPNGKLDRRALPVPGEENLARQVYEVPQGKTEMALAAIWRELLDVEQISRYDNFFALGGHSLLAMRVMNRVAALGAELPLTTLFKAPALLAFAKVVDEHLNEQNGALPVITPTPHDGALPLSFAQQRLWFLAQFEGVSDTYHIPLALRLRGQIDIHAWQQALNHLFARHEALRSVFITVNEQPQVELLPADFGLPMKKYDLRKAPEVDERLKRLCEQEAKMPFNLACGPLIRSVLIQLTDDEYIFLLTQHHIVSDGWSLGILKSELNALYSACLNQQPDPLPPLVIQYPDYAAWQRQWLSAERVQIQSDYWRMALADAPVLLDLPTDRPRPPEQLFAGNLWPINLDAELTASLKRLSEQQGVTLFMTLLSAWSIVLSRLSGQDDLVIGTPSAGRSRQEVESLIGFFVNTLALRIDLSGEPNVTELLSRVRQTALAAQEHQDLPFEQVVEIVQPPRRLAHTPLFQVMFAWQSNEIVEWRLPGLTISPVDQAFDVVKFDLELNLLEEEDRVVGYLGYSTTLFDQSTIERHVGYLHTMLQAMVADIQQPIGEMNILAPVERRLLLETWNATVAPYPEQLCVHQLIEQQVERTPDAIAVRYENQTLSYAELNTLANRLAHQLIELGVIPDQPVAICVTRSLERIVGLLAVLKAGGAYVPLDPAYPGERLAYLLTDAAPTVLLADHVGRAALGEEALKTLTVLDPNALSDQPDTNQPDNNPQIPALTSRHLAYVIYTSGSTGRPKGVMIEHQSLVNLTLEHIAQFDVGATSRMLQFASFGFDASVWEIMMALSSGAMLVIPTETIRQDPHRLWHYLEEQSVTHACLTPALLRDGADLPALAIKPTVILGGEAPSPALIQTLNRQATLFNAYGPTEITVCATTWHCPPDYTGGLIPIGRPAVNKRVYLLDKHGQPVPLGAVGELYIGGVGMARGYLNRPELTAERFLTDPFSHQPDARMYRTGDLARYLPDGNLVFVGRNDQQVKIRGFRIEPGEIETRLIEHPAVSEALVVALGDGQNKRLVAYVVAQTDDGLAASLREHLSARLPDYMVPTAFVRLDAFPLTPNGKLDRQALPAPGEKAFARQVYEAPQGEVEVALATIWRELLEVEKISRHDSFFALGGHSLLAVRMIERLRSMGLGISVQALFQHPTLNVLAQSLSQHCEIKVPDNGITPDTSVLTPEMLPLIDLTQGEIDCIVDQVPGGLANIQDIYALLPLQDGILFHHLLANEGDPYLLLTQQAFADRSLLDRYLAAVQQVVDRHDILRTAFIWEGLSAPAQVVCRQVPLFITELTLNPADGSISDQLAQRFDPCQHRIDLSQAPLLRFVIAQDTDGRWVLLQLLHHLIGDHTTLEVMNSEVQAYLTGRGDSLSAPVPFRTLVAQSQLGISQEEHTRFFTDMLAAVDEPTLPFGLTEVHHDGSQVAESHRMLTPALNNRLRNQARRLGVSVAALCHLAWAQVLSRTSDQKQVVFGTVLFGRMQAGEGADNGMGLFINTLPLRLDIDETPVRESVQAAHSRLAGLLAHEHASLALAQRCSGVASGTPLFNALLNYRHNTQPVTPDEIISGIEFLGAQERTNYPFVLSVEDGGSDLGLTAQVVQPFDPERICGYMQQALTSLAEALEQAPETPVRALNILPETERALLLETWNATETPYPEQLCIHQLFEQQAEKTPVATALIAGDQTLSYTELNIRANRLARQLIEQGVYPGEHVAILLERSIELVVAQLAILKAGAVYVPIDPSVPDERKNWLIKDCSAKLLLTDMRADIPADLLAIPLFRLSGEMSTIREEDCLNPDLPASSTGSAYIMYTSGSTGTPKGVVVPHRAVVRLVINNGYAETGQDDRVAFTANPAFDASTFEVWTPLLNGGALVVIDHDTLLTPQAFVQALQVHRITVLWLTVGLFNRLAAELSPVLPQINILIVGGDVLNPHVIAQVLRNSPPQQLLNGYGPSEGTTFTTTYRITEMPAGTTKLPIGRPIANTRLYLLNAYGEPVPLGAIGEIYIGGDGVACGYLNRPELTAERFLIDPFSDQPDARMYRTGDLARYLPDGNLEFFGRNDQQVKIRGFRIEPGEIETRLKEYPAVREAAVLVLGDGQDKRLFAYIVAQADDGLINNLRAHLSAILPDYMVPAAFVRLDEFPLTPNGKLDRRALPAPGEENFARQAYEAPQGEIETALAAIWREVLGVEQISRHDNFFALGGHSLLAVRVMNRVAAFGVELPLVTLFMSPSLAAFAERIYAQCIYAQCNEDSDRLPEITPVSRDNALPLSFSQHHLWFISQFEGVSDTYHIPVIQHLRGQFDIDAWQRALNALFARHEALRSVFVTVDGQPQVGLLPTESGLTMKKYDLRGAPDADGELKRLCMEEFGLSFDLAQGPLIRSSLIQRADDEYVFLLTLHHIIFDGWSLGILKSELSALYTAFVTGQPDPLPPLMIQYPDYAAWQRQWLSVERLQSQSDYWRTMLAGTPVLLDLPTDRPRPPLQSFIGSSLPINLDEELTKSLKRLSEQQGTTLFITILSAWAMVLSRLSGQSDLVIGTPCAGRGRQEIESLMGFFVNVLALRIDLSGTPDVTELLARVRQTTLAAQDNQDLPFEQVLEIVQPPRRLAHTPLFQVMFAWQNNEKIEWKLPALEILPVDQLFDVVKFDLELNLFEEEGRIVGSLNYATALFDQQTIERYVGYLHTVLQVMVANPQQPVREIDILSPAERRLLLETRNATETAYSEQVCIHQLFEQQVEKTPDATAVTHQAQIFSYAELNVQANRLAHQLISLGVVPDQRVAICVTRSPAMVVALLAVLKAGGAYVPLDPAYPGDRLAYMLNDAAPLDSVPLIVLADNTGRAALGEEALAKFTVLDPNTLPDQPDNSPQVPALTSRHLAYVIYTSGSTGTPKGVMVEHRGLVNLIRDKISQFDIHSHSRMLQFASFGFDASVWEIMMALCGGATLDIPADTVRQDPRRLWHYLEERAVTHACLTPALLRDGADLPEINIRPTLILGGEAPNAALIQALHGRATLFNAYGPTEITVCATTWRCPADYINTVIPIGRPTANTCVYLLDAGGQPVPLGAVGELYIGGDGVARGYLNRPDLTAERFLTDPFSQAPDARMYRTGDLARYLPDGNLIFIGRNDQQVKIRGFRIEPGEIEARLTEYPTVREAIVLALGDGQDKRLVAYVVAPAEAGLATCLYSHLRALLPDYMVPAAFVRLNAFPLTPSGKLDRRALPEPDQNAFVHQAYEAPQGEIEIALAAIWRELLEVEQIGRYDNFFALGGHSLLAMRMINLAAGRGLMCTLNDLFQFPVLAELVSKITLDPLSQPQSSAIPVRPFGTEPPLFFVPSGMYDYSYVFGLAQHIQSDYPIYALPWPSINEEPISTIEELAAKMITFMKAVQPEGRYRIYGYSSGGVLAYAIAQQLLNAGETVDFLGLIDTPAPHCFKQQVIQPKLHFLAELAKQSGGEHEEEIAVLHQRIDKLNLVQFIAAAQELELYPANLRPDLIARRWEQMVNYVQMVKEYEPQALAITLHQFYATESYPQLPFVTEELLPSLSMEPSLGWKQVVPDSSLRLTSVPGDHFSLMEDSENKTILANTLSMALN
ncbi:amino acid adenylation domain-containing protein [Xenorhabdus khoisanae]|uniref:non-ribosomal peptide synthetase n=3 Tax=Xenorhabdus TaxID=626 RepID=UPI0023584F83|nr:non-ribosomal peptide synthetase [Xenorhabdus khoisanae]MDC9613220.1 amino acid adenylation domain-containing protein [Xenorhabdus khoisanae]